VIVNGLIFTVPRKSLPGDAYDALSQKVLDSGANMNRLPYEAPQPRACLRSESDQRTRAAQRSQPP
jgi:hypothetical protein